MSVYIAQHQFQENRICCFRKQISFASFYKPKIKHYKKIHFSKFYLRKYQRNSTFSVNAVRCDTFPQQERTHVVREKSESEILNKNIEKSRNSRFKRNLYIYPRILYFLSYVYI